MACSILNVNHKIQFGIQNIFFKQKSQDMLSKIKKNKSNFERNIIILLYFNTK